MATYTDADARALVLRDPRLLAPGMRERANAFSRSCAAIGHPIRVWETARTHDLARMYFALKRSKSQDGWRTWHFYGLAIDVIHPTRMWDAWEANDVEAKTWRAAVVDSAKKSGLNWGGDWTSFKDWPHFQFNTVKPSPSDRAIDLYVNHGIWALWSEVGALGSTPGSERTVLLDGAYDPIAKKPVDIVRPHSANRSVRALVQSFSPVERVMLAGIRIGF